MEIRKNHGRYLKHIFAIFLILGSFILSCSQGEKAAKEKMDKVKGEQLKMKINERKMQVQTLLDKEEKKDARADSISDLSQMFAKKSIETNMGCGTRLRYDEYLDITDNMNSACKSEYFPADTTTRFLCRLNVVVISNPGKGSAIKKEKFIEQLRILNEKFTPVKIEFRMDIREKREERDTKLSNFNLKDTAKLRTYKMKNVLNIFVFDLLKNIRLEYLKGFTSFDKNNDVIFLSSEGVKDGTTLSHEVGHFFNLYHTHGVLNDEADPKASVNNNDCSCSGDEVCDTPADPCMIDLNYKHKYSNCVYIGTELDLDGVPFHPDLTNIMCYAEECRYKFTTGQYNRMRQAALVLRNYVLIRL